MEGLSCHPLRTWRRNEGAHTGDLIRHTRTLHRTVRTSSFIDLFLGHLLTTRNVLLMVLGIHLRLRTARRNTIDSNVAWAKVVSQTLDHALDCSLGRCVDAMAREAL